MNNEEIINAVKLGMCNAATCMHLMNFNSGGKITTEYVATVSIGQSLLYSKEFKYDDHELNFEYNTGAFITSTVPLLKKIRDNNSILKIIKRIKANTFRTGRIDVALLCNKNGINYPICAIEVKGDSPAKKLFIKDIMRNVEYLKHKDNTGNSMLNLTINCAFESYSNTEDGNDNYISETEKNIKIKHVEKKYKKYIAEISNKIPENISTEIDVFSVSQLLASTGINEEQYEEIQDRIHLSIGVMITMFPQLKNNNDMHEN